MSYRLFLDDERFPPNDGGEWVICRSLDEVQIAVGVMGFPYFISFDHDLGDQVPTGKDVANWLIDQDLDNHTMPRDFTFYVHSQNPSGAENIQGILDCYLKFRNT